MTIFLSLVFLMSLLAKENAKWRITWVKTFYTFLLTLVVALSPASIYAAKYQVPAPAEGNVSNENRVLLQRISKAVTDIAAEANKAVVFVSISKIVRGGPMGTINPFDFFFGPQGPGMIPQQPQQERKQSGIGSGFFIDLDKGYILTNNHVVEDADEISVKVATGQSYQAVVVGKDKNTDVAVVQIKDKNFKKQNLGTLPLGDSDKASVGDFVVAVGAPFGLESSLSFGIVSAMGRGSLNITELGNFIQTDAAINPGNSGGPLVNAAGQAIGINTAIFSRSGAYNGIGFAVPANLARNVAEQLINGGKIERGYIGIQLVRGADPEMLKELGIPEKVTGTFVSGVEKGGPADKAGLEAGDVITTMNGRKVDSDGSLVSEIGLLKPGTKATLTYYRNGKEHTTNVTIASRPDDERMANFKSKGGSTSRPLGMALAPLNQNLRNKYKLKSRNGLVVTAVDQNSPADRAGLQVGDLIVQVGKQPVTTPEKLNDLIKASGRALVRIERTGQFLFIPLRP